MSWTWMKSIDCSPLPSMTGASPFLMRLTKWLITEV